jgi:hypothetical protein
MAKTYELPQLGADEVWMVNPGGALHPMKKASAAERLKTQKGWRRATDEEIAQLADQKGAQVHNKPIAKPAVVEPQEE